MQSARNLHRRLQHQRVDHHGAGIVLREVEARLLEHIVGIKLSPTRALTHGFDSVEYVRNLRSIFKRSQWLYSAPIAPPLHRTRGRWWSRTPSVQHASHLWPYRPTSIGLVISNLVASNPATLPMFIEESSRVLEADGLIAMSVLGPNTLKELRQAWQSVDDQNHVADFLDMHDVGDILVENGFTGVVMDAETLTVTYPDLESALAEMRTLGVGNISPTRANKLTGVKRWQQVTRNYPHADGRTPVTLELVYAHAWRGRPKNTAEVTLAWP